MKESFSIEKFMQETNAASNPQELLDTISSHFKKLGIPATVYWPSTSNLLKDLPEQPEDRNVITSEQDKIIHELGTMYNTDGLDAIDHTKYMAKKLGRPINLFDPGDHVKTDKRYFDFLGESQAAGVSDGIIFPIYEENHRAACMAFMTYRGKLDLDEEQTKRLMMFAYFFNEKMKELLANDDNSIELSQREREVLQWAAAGKSNSDIAGILMISESSVDTYMRRCFEKLNVSNRVAAIVKAIGLGLIEVAI